MQVSVETGEGLERTITVQVPAETVELEVNNRLNTLKNTAKIDGFRPGKIPLKVIKQKYSGSVLQEVAGDLMQKSYREALMQENLNPAGDPVIKPSDLKLGQSMEYTATFEVYPEIKLAPLTDLSIEKTEAKVEDSDLDKMLDILRNQKMDWLEVDRVSADGDRITVDFVGSVDGVEFEGGAANDLPIILGKSQMIPGFEEKLTNLKATDEQTFNVTFPEDYAAKDLAGKEAEFAVTVKKVEESKLPEIDEEFAKAFGVENGDVKKLHIDIRGNMERELALKLNATLKANVMDALVAANTFDTPTAIVQQEAEALKKQFEVQSPGSNLNVDSFLDEAKTRVKLGLILAEVAKMSEITLDADSVKQKIEEMAKDYDDPDEFVQYYLSNPKLLNSVQAMLMEDKVVDWIIDQASINSIVGTFDDVMKPELGSPNQVS